MKTRKVGYWVATGLVALAMAAGGIGDLLRSPDMVAGMTALGYPLYFMTILGAWKVLGAAAILAPGLPRLKEWAYADIVFDLTGAAFSHVAAGDPVAKVIAPVVLTGLVVASWALRPESRALKAPASSAAPDPERRAASGNAPVAA